MIGEALLKLLHLLLQRRDARLPVLPPDRFIRCPATAVRCTRLAGHVGPHWARAATCSVHCMPSCSYPKCEAP